MTAPRPLKDTLEQGFKIDGHVDLLYAMTESVARTPFEEVHELPVTLDKMQRADVFVIVTAFYCPDSYNGAETSLRYFQGLLDFAGKYLACLHDIRSSADLNACIRKKEPGMIRLLENADCLLDMHPETLMGTGVRVAGLTHMGQNRIADGNNVPFPDGISSAGQQLVKRLALTGIIIDVAHLAERGFRDLVRIYDGPLISSHTGVRPLCDTPRNLAKEQIRIIMERNGIVGIAVDPNMLTPSGVASIEDTYRHIDWIAQSFEADGIAVGSDFCGFSSVNTGLEDISRLSNLAELLLQKGYPEESVRKIMGKNWHHFFTSYLK